MRPETERMIVYRAIKSWMERHHECPTISDTASRTGLSRHIVSRHMRALDGAAGLPLPVVIVRCGVASGSSVRSVSPMQMPGLFDYHAPVDRAFDAGATPRLMGWAQ